MKANRKRKQYDQRDQDWQAQMMVHTIQEEEWKKGLCICETCKDMNCNCPVCRNTRAILGRD